MKIAFHYFSGCGNSAWVVMQAQRKLQNSGHEIVLMQNMEFSLPTQMPNSDVDIFVAPTYFFGLPANFMSYLSRLPMVAARKAIFWSVNAGHAGASKYIGYNLLKDRGYDVIAHATVKMPDTFLFLKLSQMEPEERKENLKNAVNQIEENLKVLDELPAYKTEGFIKNSFSLLVFSFFHFFFRHTLGLSFVTTSKCVGCGWCAENCPGHCISFKDKKVGFKTGCIGCFRCVNACPVKAIDCSKYAFICGGVFALFLAVSFMLILPFWWWLSVLIGGTLGWFLGCFFFQMCKGIFSVEKKLYFCEKKRVWFSDDEKNL